MNNEALLQVENLSKAFPGVQALEDVSFTIKKGTVHALMGENGAGKSTLMKCLFGLYKPDAGRILLNGRPVSFHSAKQAMDAGIAMIQQELQPIYYRNVMENIWLGRYPQKKIGPFYFIDEKKLKEQTESLLATLNARLNLHTWVKNMPVAQIQIMEIAKAVSCRAKIIFMDEPATSLSQRETQNLFELINLLKGQGAAIVYISHKMDDVMRIADEVSIMRDGKLLSTDPVQNLTLDLIIKRMVGRDIKQIFPKRAAAPRDEKALEAENLTARQSGSFQNISFSLKKGEILGIGGLAGAQRTELAEALFGLRRLKSGKIFINGQEKRIKNPQEAKKNGIAFLTEERRATGIFPLWPVYDNAAIARLSAYVKRGLLRDKLLKKEVDEKIASLRIKTPSGKTLIQNLSGGNQQKVLLGRWLLTEPDILILDEPTRGIDIGAKHEIYRLANDLAAKGKSILMISSEMPELIGMADRVLVMREGRLSGILEGQAITQENIMRLALESRSSQDEGARS